MGDFEKNPLPPEQGPGQGSQDPHYEKIVLQEAYAYLEKQKYADAAKIFETVLKRFGVALERAQQSILEGELAQLYFWMGDYERAGFHAEASHRARSDNEQALALLGRIAIGRYQFPKARGYFSKISDENPAKNIGLCMISIRLRDTKGAVRFLQEAQKNIAPTDPEFRVLAAYVRLLSGNASGAASEMRELAKEVSYDPMLLLIIAEIMMTAGNYGEAEALAEKVLKVCPENDQAFAIFAHANYADEEYESAKRDAARSVKLNPRNAYAKTVLMKLATRTGNYSQAERLGKEMLDDAPEYSLAHANMGDVYFNECRYSLAELEYDQTMELMNADTKGARLRRARMKFIHEDYKEAADILKQLIQSQHTYYDDAMCDLALCYDKLEDAEKKEDVIDQMEMRRSFYHRTEKLLQAFEKER